MYVAQFDHNAEEIIYKAYDDVNGREMYFHFKDGLWHMTHNLNFNGLYTLLDYVSYNYFKLQ